MCDRRGDDAPPLSARAAELLVAEWRALGLLEDDTEEGDPLELLRGVQERASTTATRDRQTDLKLITTADPGSGLSMSEAEWPTFEGRLLRYGEVAVIGKDGAGRYTRERFLPGSLSMPEGEAPLVNRSHERNRIVGHLTGLTQVGDEVHVSGIVVDTVRDGAEALELAKAGSVKCLSIEFMSLGPRHTTVTRESSGGQLVEHSKVLLVGVGLVPQPAYRSARLTRLLDRRESGRQREVVRRRHLAELTTADRRAKAAAVRVRGLEVLEKNRGLRVAVPR